MCGGLALPSKCTYGGEGRGAESQSHNFYTQLVVKTPSPEYSFFVGSFSQTSFDDRR